MKRGFIVGIVVIVLVGLVVYFGLNLLPKSYPLLPTYPVDKAQEYNRQVTDSGETVVTTFEINRFSGNTGYKTAYFDYGDTLYKNQWEQYYPDGIAASMYNNWYSNFYTRSNGDGFQFFGQTFLAPCPPFQLRMQIEQLDANTGHLKFILTESRTRC